MELVIDENLRIKSDTHGYAIQERRLTTPTKPDETGKVPPPSYVWKDVSYYGKLDQAIRGLLDYRLLRSTATTLAELAEEIAKHKREIADLFRLTEEGGH